MSGTQTSSLSNCGLYYFQDDIGLKEWLQSLRSTHKNSLELLGNMAKKAGKIYGTTEGGGGGPGGGGANRASDRVIAPKATNGN